VVSGQSPFSDSLVTVVSGQIVRQQQLIILVDTNDIALNAPRFTIHSFRCYSSVDDVSIRSQFSKQGNCCCNLKTYYTHSK